MAGPVAVLEGLRPAWARVDLTRLAANFRAVTAASPVPIMPVVKADAYGHGAVPVARVLESLGAPLLAVAYPEEGARLRVAGIRAGIVVLGGFSSAQRRVILERDLVPVVSTPENLASVLVAAREAGRPLGVHLKVDTGMTRLGFAPADLGAAAARLAESGLVRLDGVMTHLASADVDRGETDRQLDRFDAALSDLERQGFRPRWVHAANSAGLAFVRRTHTLARPGLLLYGLLPRPLSPVVDVRPVMALAARVALVKDVVAGTAVSYGGRWVAARDSRIATIPLGYADGVPRTCGMEERGQVTIRGRRVGVAGAVCMDFVMADVTDVAGVDAGDEAVLFGDDPTAWDVADWAGTNPWQVLTSVGPRVPRVYVEDGRIVAVDSRYP